jgi:hypothetical protein
MKTALWAAVMTAVPGVVRRMEAFSFQVSEPKLKFGARWGTTVEAQLTGYVVELLRGPEIFARAVIEIDDEGRSKVVQFTGDTQHEVSVMLLELFGSGEF